MLVIRKMRRTPMTLYCVLASKLPISLRELAKMQDKVVLGSDLGPGMPILNLLHFYPVSGFMFHTLDHTDSPDWRVYRVPLGTTLKLPLILTQYSTASFSFEPAWLISVDEMEQHLNEFLQGLENWNIAKFKEYIEMKSAAAELGWAAMETEQQLPSYYQRTICSILGSVLEVYDNILIAEERQLIDKLLGLPQEAQRLFFRLVLRRAEWFRLNKLRYADIQDTTSAAAVLTEAKLLESKRLQDYAEQMTLEEMREYCRRLAISTKGKQKRPELLECLLGARVQTQTKLSFGKAVEKVCPYQQIRQLTGGIIRVVPEVLERFEGLVSLYFLTSDDPDASLSTAILTDLNRRAYPKYVVQRSGPVFATRADWLRFGEARQFAAGLQAALSQQDSVEQIDLAWYLEDGMYRWTTELARIDPKQHYFLRRFTAAWSYTRALQTVAEACERNKQYCLAETIYECLLAEDRVCLGRRGQWWERRALILHKHLKDPIAAQACLSQALSDPAVRTSSRLALQRRLTKMSRAEDWEEHPIDVVLIEGTPLSHGITGRKLVFQIDEDTAGSVEELVLHHFAQQGNWSGMHSESSIYTTLFGLLFWDILFMPVPDVFQSPFQACPLDLHTDNFYPERKDAIDTRLKHIHDEDSALVKALLVANYNHHHGTVCVGINWEAYSLESLWTVIEALGGPALSVICRVFAEDYRNHRSGMPDLILHRPSNNGQEHLLVEVKSERDRLSDAQRHWATIFSQSGVRMIVCKVKHKNT